jgi:hypothetical protein
MKNLQQVMEEIKKLLKDNDCDLKTVYYEETEQANMYLIQKSDQGSVYVSLDV